MSKQITQKENRNYKKRFKLGTRSVGNNIYI